MPARSLRTLTLASGLLAAVAVGHGQPGTPDPAKPRKPEDRILGADNCTRCHREPTPEDKGPGGASEFLRMDESAIWQKYDLHGKAFAALTSTLGRQMAERLKFDVAKSAQCLTCHAVDLTPEKKPADKSAGEFYTRFGVGCEACHGFANLWNTPHAKPSWRDEEPAAKEKLGEWDMRNPARRAERCASCHVGQPAEGKFVTHEMYAAGHPPLPAVEVMAFSRDQPMHYAFARDLPYLRDLAAKDPERCWRLFHFRGAERESQAARQVAVGAVMSFRAAMKALADAARATDPARDALDLAHFDCYACHHDLQSPSWRQERGYVGVPGRPQIRPGYALLARLVAEGTGGRAAGQFQPKFDALTAAFDRRPFGVPGEVAAAAGELVAWCDAVLKELEEVRFDKAQTARLRKQLAEFAAAKPAGPKDATFDYEAAQQLVWAADVLRSELGDAERAKRIAAELDALKGLPRQVRDPSDTAFLATRLNDRYRRMYGFEPGPFRAAFARIAALLK
jgi:hypothetical protein